MVASQLFSSRKGHIPRINLMLARSEEQTIARHNCRRNLAATGLLCALAGSVFVPLSLRALTLRAQVMKAQQAGKQELRRVEQNAPPTGDVDARLAQWARFTKSREQRLVWHDALCAIVAPVPAQIAVERIQMESKGDTIMVTLNGSSETIGVARDYIGMLERGAGLRQAHLTGATSDVNFGPEATSFTVSAQAGKAAN